MHVRDVPTAVISRIAKLLRLAERKDTPEHEAKAAAGMAERLMDKWDIEVDAGLEVDTNASEISFVVETQCVPWRSTLAAAVAELYGCIVKVTRSVADDKPRYYMRLEGEPEPLLRLRLHYRHLETEIERALSTFLTPRDVRHIRALGAARFVSHLILEHLGADAPPEEPSEEPPLHMPPAPPEDDGPALPPPESSSTALMKVPRQRVRAPVDPTPPPQDDHVLELDLPEDEQQKGVELVGRRPEIYKYAARPHPALELPIEAVAMGGKRAQRAIRALGVQYIGELVAMRASQLLSIPGVGPATVTMIESDLALEGLHLRPEDVFPEK